MAWPCSALRAGGKQPRHRNRHTPTGGQGTRSLVGMCRRDDYAQCFSGQFARPSTSIVRRLADGAFKKLTSVVLRLALRNGQQPVDLAAARHETVRCKLAAPSCGGVERPTQKNVRAARLRHLRLGERPMRRRRGDLGDGANHRPHVVAERLGAGVFSILRSTAAGYFAWVEKMTLPTGNEGLDLRARPR